MRGFNKEVGPIGDMDSEPLPDSFSLFFEIIKIGRNDNAFFKVQNEASEIGREIKDGFNNFEKFVASQGTSYIVSAPAKCEVIVIVFVVVEFGLEFGELLKEGVGTYSEAQSSGWAPLDDASEDKIKESLETTRNINSIVI